MSWLKGPRALMFLWSLALVAVLGIQVSLAQDAQDADEADGTAAAAAAEDGEGGAAAEEADETGTMWEMVQKMDWAGWVFLGILLAFSIFGTMIAIERLVNLTRNKLMPAEFCNGLDQLVARQEVDPAAYRSLCQHSQSAISQILKAGLLRAGRTLPEVEKSMEDAAAREISALRGRNRPLAVVGSVAPLVGLLGTVFGMIIAFRSASQAGLGKAEVLAEGIYLALLTTAAGLTIAIPALIVVAVLNARVERYMRELDEELMETMPAFARMEQRPAAEQPLEKAGQRGELATAPQA